MIQKFLGRYEYHDENGNSHKQWTLKKDKESDGYIALWGRVGAKPQVTHYDEATALKKVREKILKGYEKVGADDTEKVEAQVVDIKKKSKVSEESDDFDFMQELKKVLGR